MNLKSFLNNKIVISLGVFALPCYLTLGIKNLLEEEFKITDDIIEKALYKASGEDGNLNNEEKARFIRDIGLEYSVQEGQKLFLSRREIFVGVYLDSSRIGAVSRDTLERYVDGLKVESE